MSQGQTVVHVEDVQAGIILLEVNLGVVGVCIDTVGFNDGEDAFYVGVLDLEKVLGNESGLGLSRDSYGT